MKILFTSYHITDVEDSMSLAQEGLGCHVTFEPLLGFNTLEFEYLVLVVDSKDHNAFDLLRKIKTKNVHKKIILAFKEKSEIDRTQFSSELCFNLRLESYFLLDEAAEFFTRFKNQVLTTQSPLFGDVSDGPSGDDLDRVFSDEEKDESFESLKYLERFIKSYYPSQKLLFDHFILDYQIAKFDKQKINDLKRLSEGIYLTLKKEMAVSALLTNIYSKYPGTLGHTFLTSIYAGIIAENLDWAEKKTVDLVIRGALLHNIGYLDIDESMGIDVQNIEELSGLELYEYQNYPMYGYNALKGTSIGLQVKQIIFQHQEYLDGSGYPNGLSGMKVFPLARIVAFASDFARLISKDHLSPTLGMKKLIGDKDLLLRYEANCIKAFIKGMIS